MDVTQYIKESCEIQGATTPEDFIGMARAYDYALERMWTSRRERDVIYLSDLPPLICRIRNQPTWCEFRCQPAVFANGNMTHANDRATILRQVSNLLDAQDSLTADEFYQQFEEIHPWDDGNGRVGSILWNYLNKTIQNPVHPPAFKDMQRGFGARIDPMP